MVSEYTTGSNREAFATPNDIRELFHRHRTELEWLAHFVTTDKALAEACVSDACASSKSATSIFKEWLANWARYSTIRSAVQTQRSCIKRLAPKYERTGCVHHSHEPLSRESLEFVVEESWLLINRLDVVSRTALVMCGIEGHSIADAAVMMGISRASSQAAYCAALDYIEVLRCQCLAADSGDAAASN